MAIHIIQGKRNLSRFLNSQSTKFNGKYILLDNQEDCLKLLSRYGYSRIEPKSLDIQAQEDFLREYLDLIGLLGCEVNSRTWWATDMASKNRETSRLPFLLQEFKFVTDAISKADADQLLIVNPSWVLLDSLKAFLLKRNIAHDFRLCSFDRRKELMIARATAAMRVLYIILLLIMRAAYIGLRMKKKERRLDKTKRYYVIKTFLYSQSFQDNGYRDAFFGSLPDYLEKKVNVLILADMHGRRLSFVDKLLKYETHSILPLELFVNLGVLLKTAIECIAPRLKAKKEYLFFGQSVTGVINAELERTRGGIDFYQLLHYGMMRRLLSKFKVDTFLLTYENNPWEKMCMLAFRDFSPATRIIGYQHTVVPQASANAFISVKEKAIIPTPDRILTVGKTPKDIMEKYGCFDPDKIEPSCGLRFEYLFEMRPNCERKKQGRILLAGEGLEGMHILVNYVIRELAGSHQYRIRIRTHPALPLKVFKDKLTRPIQTIPNFEISESKSLKDDLEWTDMVIYWGSTVSLEAVKMGKPIIRYNMDKGLNYDPLFECGHLKWIVNDSISLSKTIQDVYELEDSEFMNEWESAKSYIEEYFYPVNAHRLDLFLDCKNKRSTAHAIS